LILHQVYTRSYYTDVIQVIATGGDTIQHPPDDLEQVVAPGAISNLCHPLRAVDVWQQLPDSLPFVQG